MLMHVIMQHQNGAKDSDSKSDSPRANSFLSIRCGNDATVPEYAILGHIQKVKLEYLMGILMISPTTYWVRARLHVH